MSSSLTDRIHSSLSNRRDNGLIRRLRPPQHTACDFCSNDYLGLARSKQFQSFFTTFMQLNPVSSSGSTGSRLLSGHSELISSLEQDAAQFHQMPDALLFNSGYDANLSVLSCVPGPSDAIIYDEFVHASMHDGIKLSRVKERMYSFSHNNVQSMIEAIQTAINSHCESVLVCIETVYSMDGDIAPLRDMLSVCASLQKEHGKEIHLVVDEAHAGGVFGPNGEGIVVETESTMHPNLFAVIVTFGKAFAAHGAIVLSRSYIKEYLINYSRPFIYSTALSPHSVSVIRAMYEFMKSHTAHEARARLHSIISYFQKVSAHQLPAEALLKNAAKSPIQGISVPGNRNCVSVANNLRVQGLDVYPVRSPTVFKGTERIRIILHAHNSKDDIDRLIRGLLHSLHCFVRSRL